MLSNSITQSYLELQRLRRLVREAEISRTARHGVKRGCRRRHDDVSPLTQKHDGTHGSLIKPTWRIQRPPSGGLFVCDLWANSHSRREHRARSTRRTLPYARRCPAVNRSSSIKVSSTAALKESIAQSYLELQRLRQLVREAERSLTPRGVNTTTPGSRINPRRRHSG